MVTDAELLAQARDLISEPEHWRKGMYSNENDTAHCMLGSIRHIVGMCEEYVTDEGYKQYDHLTQYLHESVGDHIPDFNDTHTHADVMEAFDRAIKLAKEAADNHE